mgnify:CR=1 FL=1
MVRDIEDKLFRSLDKYYGRPDRTNKLKYRRGYRKKCCISKYVTDYQKSFDRFLELYNKHSHH